MRLIRLDRATKVFGKKCNVSKERLNSAEDYKSGTTYWKNCVWGGGARLWKQRTENIVNLNCTE